MKLRNCLYWYIYICMHSMQRWNTFSAGVNYCFFKTSVVQQLQPFVRSFYLSIYLIFVLFLLTFYLFSFVVVFCLFFFSLTFFAACCCFLFCFFYSWILVLLYIMGHFVLLVKALKLILALVLNRMLHYISGKMLWLELI